MPEQEKIEELTDSLKRYVNTNYELIKLEATERTSTLASGLISVFIIGFISVLFIFFIKPIWHCFTQKINAVLQMRSVEALPSFKCIKFNCKFIFEQESFSKNPRSPLQNILRKPTKFRFSLGEKTVKKT